MNKGVARPARGQLFARKSVDQCIADGERGGGLRRSLGPIQLTSLGVGAIIGAGIFAAIGTAIAGDSGHVGAGAAIVISIILAGVTSAFAAITYSEFAALIPISGSAYTYAYATLGEVFAWIIGWDLILEMLLASAVIAKFWGVYLADAVGLFGADLAGDDPAIRPFAGGTALMPVQDMFWGDRAGSLKDPFGYTWMLGTRVKDLTDAEVGVLRDYIGQHYKVEGDLRRSVQMNIKRLIEIGSYRGLRHRRNLPVRGQRTRTNSRTRKGPKKTVAGRGRRRGATKK